MLKLFLPLLLTLSIHSGRTDSNGGHRDNINGGYHYHHGCAAHSHSGGCRYDYRNCERDYSYSDYSNDEDDFDFWSFLLISWIIIVVGGFVYDSITTVLTRRREEKEKINNEKQRIIDEENRINEKREREYGSLIKSNEKLSLEIKSLISDYNDTTDDKNKLSIIIKILKLNYRNRFTDSIEWSSKGLKLTTKIKGYSQLDYFHLLTYRGIAYIDDREYLKAINEFKRILKLDKNNIPALNNIASCKIELKQYSDAIIELDTAINSNQTQGQYLSFYFRAKIKKILSQKDSDYGLSDINKSLEINPKHLKSYPLKSEILLETSQSYVDAITVINEGLNIFEDDLYLTYLRGLYRFKNSDYNNAFKDFNKVIKFKPTLLISYKQDKNWFFGYAHYFRSKIYDLHWTKLDNKISLNLNVNTRKDLRNADLKEAIKYNNKEAIKRWMKIS